MSSRGELIPLRHFADENAREILSLERLTKAWPIVAGPASSRVSRPISIRHGLLLIGCFNAGAIEHLRVTAQQTWPEWRDRIYSMLKIRLQRVDITPCDADTGQPKPGKAHEVQARTKEVVDPLDEVLKYYRRTQEGPVPDTESHSTA